MARRKREKILALKTMPNVFEEPKALKGNWNKEVFQNDHPVILELGCGKGEYTINLAKHYPQYNFIGVDVKGPRLHNGAKEALDLNLYNVAFLRILIERIDDFFEKGEVSEIWITFPDPYPRKSKAGKRLISPRFLDLYCQILEPNSMVHFKTDNEALFNYGLEVLNEKGYSVLGYTYNLYHSNMLNHLTAIQTTYEKKFLAEGLTIKYLHFRLS
ncbi:MAG: tRNA (guanosine(46)-N7)-methyltransferase TrmB [Bacteroidia bacterium]